MSSKDFQEIKEFAWGNTIFQQCVPEEFRKDVYELAWKQHFKEDKCIFARDITKGFWFSKIDFEAIAEKYNFPCKEVISILLGEKLVHNNWTFALNEKDLWNKINIILRNYVEDNN